MDFDTERKFLLVKERLDALHLPTIFPNECVDLLHRLVGMVQSTQQYVQPAKRDIPASTKDDSSKVRAITQELQRTIKQNNTLHVELIHFKEENQVLKKRIAKLETTKTGLGHNELVKLKDQTAKELQEQLATVTRKYNELLHRAYNKENGFDNLDEQYKERNMKRQINQAMPDKKHMQLRQNDREASQLGRDKIHPPAADRHFEESNDLKERLEFLNEKIKNREAEITRLHNKLEFDGVNMNKLLKDFEKHETSSRLDSLNHQIDLLNKQNFKLKEELKKVKNNSSHAEVLRRENEKQKTNNKNDKSNFEKDTKKWEEREFQLVTALKKLNFDFTQLQKLLKERDEEIDGLKHSITSYVHSAEFHQKELKQVQEKAKVVDHKNVTLETGYEQMRNNVESEKIFLSYELEDLKKKFREAEFAVREYQEKNESLELRYKKLEEVHRVGLEEDQIKSATLTNQEEIIGEQHRIIAELKITLEADRKKLRSLERPHDSLNFKSSSQEDERLRLKGEVGASDEYSRGRHFEELSASFQVLSSQKSVLERDIRQVRLMNEQLQERLEKANHSYSKNVEELKQANDLLRQDVRELQTELDTLKVANNSLSKAKEVSEFELRKLKSELHFMQESVQDAQSVGAQFERAKNALKKAESNTNALAQKIKALEQDKLELARQVESAEAKNRSSRDSERRLKEVINRLEEGVSELEDERSRLQSDTQVRTHRINELQHNLNETIKQIKERDERILELEGESDRLRKDKLKLERKLEDSNKEKLLFEQRGMKQDFSGNEQNQEIFWLRRELNNMVEKTDKYVVVNRELNELAIITKKENEQMLQDLNGFKKEVEHLRMLCQESELNLQKSRLNEQRLLQNIQGTVQTYAELEIRSQQFSGDARWQEEPVGDPLKTKIDKAQQQFQKQMRESKDTINKK